MPESSLPYIVLIRDNALELYCQWLNRWEPDSDHPYKPEHFTIMDPDRRLWGETQLIAYSSISAGAVPSFYHFTCTDGDEGGGHDLYVWADDDGAIAYLVQGFDTSLTMIYRAEYPLGLIDTTKPYERVGEFLNIP